MTNFINSINSESKKALLAARRETIKEMPCFKVPQAEFNKVLHQVRTKNPRMKYAQAKLETRRIINKEYEKNVLSKHLNYEKFKRKVNVLSDNASRGKYRQQCDNPTLLRFIDHILDDVLVSIGH